MLTTTKQTSKTAMKYESSGKLPTEKVLPVREKNRYLHNIESNNKRQAAFSLYRSWSMAEHNQNSRYFD